MSCVSCGGLTAGEPGLSITTMCRCDFTSVADAAGGLVGELGDVVDCLRDIETQLGARQDEVRLVWSRWTGGQRGVGDEYVFHEVVIEPTPAVQELTALRLEITEAGRIEVGGLEISEISPRYSERLLLGEIDGEIQPDTNFYWEVTRGLDDPSKKPVRRRFFPASPPHDDETGFQWKIKLERAHGDRIPDGLPRRDPSGVES